MVIIKVYDSYYSSVYEGVYRLRSVSLMSTRQIGVKRVILEFIHVIDACVFESKISNII